MSTPSASVREYMAASQDLLALNDLTDEELELVQEMSDRLSEKFNSEDEG